MTNRAQKPIATLLEDDIREPQGARQQACPDSKPVSGASMHWRFWVGGGFMALCDQGLIATSNFVISVLLARWLQPAQYGSYALAFELFLLMSLSYQALVLEPQRIFGPTDYRNCQREYLGAILRVHAGVVTTIFCVVGLAAYSVYLLFFHGSLPLAVSAAAFAAPCILLLWLVRSALYVRLRPQDAVVGALLYCATLAGTITFLYKFKMLTVFSAFIAMGIAALVSSGALLLTAARPRMHSALQSNSLVKKHWSYGRWILLSSVLSWLTGSIYYPVVSAGSGLGAAGFLKVLLTLSLPPAQAFNALSIFVLPYASRAYTEEGASALASLISRMSWLFAAGGVGYWAIIMLFSKPVITLLYGATYAQVAGMVPLVACGSLAWNVAYVPMVGLRASRFARSVLFTYLAAGAVAIIAGIPMTLCFGLRGALIAMLVSNVAALLASFVLFTRSLRTPARS